MRADYLTLQIVLHGVRQVSQDSLEGILSSASWWKTKERQQERKMHCEDLMSPDLLSEIVLLVFGSLIVVSLSLFLLTVLTRTSA